MNPEDRETMDMTNERNETRHPNITADEYTAMDKFAVKCGNNLNDI